MMPKRIVFIDDLGAEIAVEKVDDRIVVTIDGNEVSLDYEHARGAALAIIDEAEKLKR